MKKVLAMVLALALVLCLPLGVAAANASISIPETKVPIGRETVSVNVQYACAEKVYDGTVIITFPADKLTYVAVTSEAFDQVEVNTAKAGQGLITVSFVNSEGAPASGTLLTLQLRNPAPAQEDEMLLTVQATRLAAANTNYAETVSALSASGKVIVTTPSADVFDYKNDAAGTGVTVTGYNGGDKSVTLPEKIDDKTVTGVDKGAFTGSGITDITVLGKTTAIADGALDKGVKIICYRESAAAQFAKANGYDVEYLDSLDYTALDAELALAATLDLTAYEADSAADYTAALQAAEALKEDDDATQSAIDEALAALQDARAALKPVTPPAAGDLLGDVDGSGTVDSTDARLILQYYAKKIGENDLDLTVADVDDSGTVDSTDARLILQYYAKKIEALPGAVQA